MLVTNTAYIFTQRYCEFTKNSHSYFSHGWPSYSVVRSHLNGLGEMILMKSQIFVFLWDNI